jgi:glutamate-1-semialdehyde 2,1-aminomutase
MKYVDQLTPADVALAAKLKGFVPGEAFDIHVHPFNAAHFPAGSWPSLAGDDLRGCASHRAALQRYMPSGTLHGLYFGLPHKAADRPAVNAWVRSEVGRNGTRLSRALRLTTPNDNPDEVAAALRNGEFCGLKVYHCYAPRADTMNAAVEEYAPDWMWELLHETQGVLMLHIVRDDALDDPANQQSLRRLCRAYPRARLILAHIARSFNYRNAREGLKTVADLDNAVVDTSAIAEPSAFAAALKILGPRRVLWGSDFPISEIRGRCVATGSAFFWLTPEVLRPEHSAPTKTAMTLVGLESLLCLREACEDAGFTRGEVEDIFLHNALRTLAPHLPAPTPAGGAKRA